MSSTRTSLRRSRRATKKESSEFKVGDIVELNRGSSNTVTRARLAQLLTVTTSPNPRWLVKFDGQPFKDEEVYEHTFSRVVSPADNAEDDSNHQSLSNQPEDLARNGFHVRSSSPKEQRFVETASTASAEDTMTKVLVRSQRKKQLVASSPTPSPDNNSESSHYSTNKDVTSKMSMVPTSTPPPPQQDDMVASAGAEQHPTSTSAGEESSSSTSLGVGGNASILSKAAAAAARVSAREERSRRRQATSKKPRLPIVSFASTTTTTEVTKPVAVLQPAPVLLDSSSLPVATTTIKTTTMAATTTTTSSTHNTTSHKRNRDRERVPGTGRFKSSKRSRCSDDENCVKIKFLTGTLYLYRGRHRRAEFIRRV